MFHSYWKIGCNIRQRDYLLTLVKKSETKSATKTGSRRKFKVDYSLKLHGKTVNVCQTMFLETFDITAQVVKTALSKQTDLGTCDEERRGKHTKRGKQSKEVEKEAIRKHIRSFPRVESHYCRKQTEKEYLESCLDLTTMYGLYKEERTALGYIPVGETVYRYIFNYEFNIEFNRRMKDRCDTCTSFENSAELNEEEQDEYRKHLKLKADSRIYKDKVKTDVKHQEGLTAAVFDLQEVLPSPKGEESCLFYKRKLNVYNFTMYNLSNKQGHCYTWAEHEGLRGSNEVSSCVYDFLEKEHNNGAKEAILFADACGGQNRNKNVLSMLWLARHKFDFNKVELNFFVTGHSQNEGDSIHSLIEKKSKTKPVYTPAQWAQRIRDAKKSKPQLKVYEVSKDFFRDFKKVAAKLINFEVNTSRERVKWLQIRRVQILKAEPNLVRVFYDFTESYSTLNLLQKNRRSIDIHDPAAVALVNAYSEHNKISAEKYKDLVCLCDKNIIPPVHQDFFRALPHE